MKAKHIFLAVLIVLVCATVLWHHFRAETPSDRTAANETVLQTGAFRVRSDSTDLNTSATGTVFMKGTEGTADQIQIVAFIEIDPDDWGGVSIYLPRGWYIAGLQSSYPEEDAQVSPADDVSVWNTAESDYELNKAIEIGRSHDYIPTGGGTGTVVIDLAPDPDAAASSASFHMMVAVGCDEKNGMKIVGPDSVELELPLSPAAGAPAP
jgi:hypothetical protein